MVAHHFSHYYSQEMWMNGASSGRCEHREEHPSEVGVQVTFGRYRVGKSPVCLLSASFPKIMPVFE